MRPEHGDGYCVQMQLARLLQDCAADSGQTLAPERFPGRQTGGPGHVRTYAVDPPIITVMNRPVGAGQDVLARPGDPGRPGGGGVVLLSRAGPCVCSGGTIGSMNRLSTSSQDPTSGPGIQTPGPSVCTPGRGASQGHFLDQVQRALAMICAGQWFPVHGSRSVRYNAATGTSYHDQVQYTQTTAQVPAPDTGLQPSWGRTGMVLPAGRYRHGASLSLGGGMGRHTWC